jgi:site-specific DNA-methyltransferase (adenine-specific)
MVRIYNQDCLLSMKIMKDNEYDLAIVDPPYGIGMDKKHFVSDSSQTTAGEYTNKTWDTNAPSPQYFQELQRVSKHQIIFGANHFIESIPNANSSCWIVWDKNNGSSIHADCELAYASFKTSVRMFRYTWHGMRQENMKNKEHRIHPTQKPVALYYWLLQKYAKPGWRILDTHLGSGSIAIAAHDLGFDFDGYELDKEYYDNAMKRFRLHSRQRKLF